MQSGHGGVTRGRVVRIGVKNQIGSGGMVCEKLKRGACTKPRKSWTDQFSVEVNSNP